MAQEDRIVDYLVCRNCSTPCYVFEMDGEKILEALCQACGNDNVNEFTLGDIEEE